MHLLTDEAQPEAGGITQTSKFKPSRAPKDATETREKERATNWVNENYATRRKSLLNSRVSHFPSSLPNSRGDSASDCPRNCERMRR